jgi:hypothetical protein
VRAVARLAAILPVAVVASLTALGSAGPAAGAPSCEQQVLRDWHADGRVDRTYELACYQAAVESLPSDLRDYTNAQEEIERALQSAARSGAAEAPRRPPASSSSSAVAVPALALAATVALASGGVWYARRARSTRADGDGPA